MTPQISSVRQQSLLSPSFYGSGIWEWLGRVALTQDLLWSTGLKAGEPTSKMAGSQGCRQETSVPLWLLAGGLSSDHMDISTGHPFSWIWQLASLGWLIQEREQGGNLHFHFLLSLETRHWVQPTLIGREIGLHFLKEGVSNNLWAYFKTTTEEIKINTYLKITLEKTEVIRATKGNIKV